MRPLLIIGSQAENKYQFTDRNVKVNELYRYRLRIIGNDRTTYSEIRTAKLTGKNVFVGISPNPSKGNFRVEISGYKGKAELSVLNVQGQEIYRKAEIVEDGRQVNIDISKQPKGVYTLRVRTGDETSVEKLVIQ